MTLQTEPVSRSQSIAGDGHGPTTVDQIQSPSVRRWIDKCVEHCKPDDLYLCDGSEAQKRQLLERAVAEKTLIRLNQQKLPGCYLHRSNPNDVARTEQLTFICTPSEDMVGPTNNWIEVKAGYAKLRPLFDGAMRAGRCTSFHS